MMEASLDASPFNTTLTKRTFEKLVKDINPSAKRNKSFN
jgi:hypothetical protein